MREAVRGKLEPYAVSPIVTLYVRSQGIRRDPGKRSSPLAPSSDRETVAEEMVKMKKKEGRESDTPETSQPVSA